jgi:nucleoside-diphosphate-sugar epimerase
MNILITGHRGFVGYHFLQKYKNENIYGIDIKDGNDARDFFKLDSDKAFDVVIHLAAVVGGRQTIENSPISVAVDLSIDSEFFSWCLRNKPKHVIYFSSSAAYPIEYQFANSRIKLEESMIDLDNVKSPDLTYGWAKLTGEYLAKFISKEVPVTIFRPFSGYGTNQDLTYPFPSFIDRAKQRLNPFQIWGDGNQVRDFIHIKDIINAVDVCIKEKIYGTFNLGSGEGVSFNDLCELVCKACNYKPAIQHLKAQPTGVMYRVCNPSKMLEFYKPQISLEQGIDMALKGII